MAEVKHNLPFCSIKGRRRGDKSIELTIIQHAQTDPAANDDLSGSHVCKQIASAGKMPERQPETITTGESEYPKWCYFLHAFILNRERSMTMSLFENAS